MPGLEARLRFGGPIAFRQTSYRILRCGDYHLSCCQTLIFFICLSVTEGRSACADDHDSLRLNLPMSTDENFISGSEYSQFDEVGPLSSSEARATQGSDDHPVRMNLPRSFDQDVVPNWEIDQPDHSSHCFQTLMNGYSGKHRCGTCMSVCKCARSYNVLFVCLIVVS